MRILLVEDDAILQKVLRTHLMRMRFAVDIAGSAEPALKLLAEHSYDCVLLDVGLPGKSGVQLCRQLREEGDMTPVIMLTGYDTQEYIVKGLDAGADDYMAKPYDPDELLARIRAVLRRPKYHLPSKLKVADLELDPVNSKVQRGGKPIKLMPKEYALLEHLLRHKDQLVTKHDLLQHVWGVYSNTSSNRLEVYMSYLRQKVDAPFGRALIKTVRGKGYIINES